MLAEKEVVRAEVHARWVSGGWGDLETPAQRAARHHGGRPAPIMNLDRPRPERSCPGAHPSEETMTENTTEGRVRLAPHEEERLRALLRRSDAFGTALAALEGEETAYPDVHAEYVGVLWEEHRLA